MDQLISVPIRSILSSGSYMEKIRVVLFGVGAIGSSIAKFLLEKEGVEIVGAIDIATDKIVKDLG